MKQSEVTMPFQIRCRSGLDGAGQGRRVEARSEGAGASSSSASTAKIPFAGWSDSPVLKRVYVASPGSSVYQ